MSDISEDATLRDHDVVKGSHQDELVIVRYNSGYRLRRAVWLVVTILMVGVGAYLYGYFAGHEKILTLSTELNQQVNQLSEVTNTQSDLQQRLSIYEMGEAIDQGSADNLRDTLVTMSSRIAELEHEVAFYKGIMSSESSENVLRVSRINVRSTDVPNVFSYALTLAQTSVGSKDVLGNVLIEIEGKQDGKSVTLPLNDLNSEVPKKGISFSFRYFQELKGTLTLPENFVAEQIHVKVHPKSSSIADVKESRLWIQ